MVFILQLVINALTAVVLCDGLNSFCVLCFVLASQKDTTESWIHLHGRRVFHRGCQSNERGRTGSKRGTYCAFVCSLCIIFLAFNTCSNLYFLMYVFFLSFVVLLDDNLVPFIAFVQLEIFTIKRISRAKCPRWVCGEKFIHVDVHFIVRVLPCMLLRYL